MVELAAFLISPNQTSPTKEGERIGAPIGVHRRDAALQPDDQRTDQHTRVAALDAITFAPPTLGVE